MEPTEFFASMHVAVFALPIVGAVVLGMFSDWSAWAVDHGLLAPASDEPLLAVPFADGAGLDVRRVVIGVVVVVALVVAAAAIVRPWRRRAALRAMRQGDM